LTYRGTDTGEFLKGLAATGEPVEFGAIYIWPIVDNKHAEHGRKAIASGLWSSLAF
jgi:hypothetical protein